MRIAITGLGMTNAAGPNSELGWKSIIAGRSGIVESELISATGVTNRLAGQATVIPEKGQGHLDRSFAFAYAALKEAVDMAGLDESPYEETRRGLVVGTSLGAARQGERFHRKWISDGLDAAPIGLLRNYPLHSSASFLAREFGLLGPRTVHSNACAASAVAIAHGAEYLRSGDADVVVAGGLDPLAYLSFGGFSCLGALSTGHCAPYSRSDGLNLGEGAGFLVLERLESAEARNAEILAYLEGYGLSLDAYHATAPDPRGYGAAQAMNRALSMGQRRPDQVGYINGHGTGTPTNDASEAKIFEHFGAHHVPMSSTKSMIGHTLGAAGAIEAVVTVMALSRQMIPPTHVPEGLSGTTAFDLVPNVGRAATIDAALSNSFAFGGNNASLLLTTEPSLLDAERVPPRRQRCVVTHYAAMIGDAGDALEVEDALFGERSVYGSRRVQIENFGDFPVGEIPDEFQRRGVNPSMLRKLDPLGRRAVAVAGQLFRTRRLSRAEAQNTGLILSTSSGPISTVEAFQRGLISEGVGNARLFPNTVMNAAAGHVAVQFGLRGPTATICSGSTGTVGALHFATQLLRSGAADRMIILAVDEAPDALIAGYAKIPGFLSRGSASPFCDSGLVFSGGAVAVMLELESGDGGQEVLASVDGFGFAGDGSKNGRVASDGVAWALSLTAAATNAGILVSEADLVVCSAGGRRQVDDSERRALALAGAAGSSLSVPKRFLGEIQSAGPLLGVLAGIWAKRRSQIPAPVEPQTRADIERVLVSAADPGGNYQAVVFGV